MRNCKGEVAESVLHLEHRGQQPQQPPFVAACRDDIASEQLRQMQRDDHLGHQGRASAVSASPPSTDAETARCAAEYIGEESNKKPTPVVATVKPFLVRPSLAVTADDVDPSRPLGAGGSKIAELTPGRRSAHQPGGERHANRPTASPRSSGRSRASAAVDSSGTADTTPRGAGVTTISVGRSRGNDGAGTRETADSRRTQILVGDGQPAVVAVTTPSSDRRARASNGTDDSLRMTSSIEALPDGYARVARCLQLPSSERDEERLIANCRLLEQCSFYAGSATSNEAKNWLRDSRVGTFLVRDSAHPRYLYSLSVKTRRGITSIRLAYDSRGFALDSDPDQTSLMPVFETVVELVSFYTAEGRRTTAADGELQGQNRSSCVFLERSGRRDLPVFLRFPHRGGGVAQSGVSSLKHLSRLSINGALGGRCPDRLVIKPSLKEYLKRYPFDI